MEVQEAFSRGNSSLQNPPVSFHDCWGEGGDAALDFCKICPQPALDRWVSKLVCSGEAKGLRKANGRMAFGFLPTDFSGASPPARRRACRTQGLSLSCQAKGLLGAANAHILDVKPLRRIRHEGMSLNFLSERHAALEIPHLAKTDTSSLCSLPCFQSAATHYMDCICGCCSCGDVFFCAKIVTLFDPCPLAVVSPKLRHDWFQFSTCASWPTSRNIAT